MPDIEAIKKLRAQTGAGMMDAKGALEEAKGDFDKAIEVLRKKGLAKAAKKSDREAKNGLIESYIHMGRVGTIVEVNCETDFVARTEDFQNLVKDVAMHIAATNPVYLNPEDVPKEVIAKEKEIYAVDIKDKPKDVATKIIQGKLDKFYEENCLLRQPFIKDEDKSVEEVIKQAIAKLGENIIISRFARFELGENNG
ncbi:MAG: translation elongation factor Ts [Candidatus Saccharimonadales bacterium]